MTHTREPWKAKKHAGLKSVTIYCVEGRVIATVRPRRITGEMEANARRIVACINACKGIATEDLEQGLVTIQKGEGDHEQRPDRRSPEAP